MKKSLLLISLFTIISILFVSVYFMTPKNLATTLEPIEPVSQENSNYKTYLIDFLKSFKPKKLESLPVVGSYDNLKAMLEEAQERNATVYGWGQNRIFLDGVEDSAVAESASNTSKSSPAQDDSSGNHSTTNSQVEGVDEADVIKTDGKYIYQVNEKQIVIAQAYPSDDMKVVSTLDFTDENFNPREIYVDDNHLVVIGSTSIEHPMVSNEKEDQRSIYPSFRYQSFTKAMLYDITNKANVSLLREVELEGNYVSSRKIGSNLYFTTNNYIDTYHIMNEKKEYPTPAYSDSTLGEDYINIDYDKIQYFPNSIEPNYLTIGGLNLDSMNQPMTVSTFLGSGENIYASTENLYITITEYEMDDQANPENTSFPQGKELFIPKVNSTIYKFSLDKGNVTYTSKGSVPGRILNQFSMDEHQGHFRIATTTGEMWRNDENISKNNIYILDSKLALTGKVENIAPGERIYSVRFMGDRGYMVTFRTVDPLFVIDLQNPSAPKILGELKIPGFSNYLHPYDENHLIGFGKDALEVTITDWQGKPMPTAFEMGMKISLFDVSDVQNPVEKFTETIGDRGTHSELLYNHKALLFSKERNLLAFPISVMEVKGDKLNSTGHPQHGTFAFQGAYIYELDMEKGFRLQGTISHLSEKETEHARNYWYDYDQHINRILYIGDTLYTSSSGMIKASELRTLQELNKLKLKEK
jgi:inhibitor of cysteine peptidase